MSTDNIAKKQTSVIDASNQVLRLSIIGCVLLMPVAAAAQNGGHSSGKAIVESVCATCHTSGKDGAPKIGDKQAWAKRTSQGLTGLTRHAITGIRKMPAHGGSGKVSDNDLTSAITYMVNQSGGNWIEPTIKGDVIADRSGEQIVALQCAKCHKTGLKGAPKMGDRAAWIPRGAHGMDALVRSAINGHGGMPARGGMAGITDAEMRNAVIYMFNQGVIVAK